MNWKLKGLGQSALSRLPYAGALNYFGQKFITKAHAAGPPVADRLEKARWFTARFREYHGGNLSDARFFEFGAGWDLAGPLALYCLGANSQCVVDIRPCARLELVNQTIAELNRRSAEVVRLAGAPLGSLGELEMRFGIRYQAPADARGTLLGGASVDCIVSTYTMEHIPVADLQAILAEARRILKPAGLILSLIDYQDHYSYRDAHISVYNFLQYTERQWRWFNSPLHYQNRLRHSQYRQLFADAGFEILAEDLKLPGAPDLDRFRGLRLAPAFGSFAVDDLTILGSGMVCRASQSGQPVASAQCRELQTARI
jgi:SAM-dependent methyltransferase